MVSLLDPSVGAWVPVMAGGTCTRRGAVTIAGGELSIGSIPTRTSDRKVDRRHVTVLAIDIVSPMHAPAAMHPELSARQMDLLLATAFEIVEANGGVTSSSGESGITAVFGTSPASEHHELSACQAALEIKSRLEQQSEGAIHVHAGLDTGEVTVRHRSHVAAGQVEVMGGAVRTAAALAKSLRRGVVAATGRTRAAALDLFDWVGLSRSDLLRFDRDEQAYELKRVG